MSEHFRKAAPHYDFPSVRSRLEEWLEDQVSGTLFGPKGCGKDTFLKDFFNEEKRLELASRREKPMLVLLLDGTSLTHCRDLDDLLSKVFEEGFAYLQQNQLIDPASAPLLTCAAGASPQGCAQEWKKRHYCFVLVISGFHNFICNIDGSRTDSVQQVNILKNSDAPLRMIVTNDYLYTSQYCPAMEDLAGSSIFNNLSINQFTFSKNRPRPQEFTEYLGRLYREGDASPFTPEEERWLLEMTGGFPSLVSEAAEALLLAKEDGLTGQEEFEDCLRTCMLPEDPIYLLLSQWLKDLDDTEFEILTQISKFGLSGADEEDVDRPKSVQRGLVYTDRRSRHWRLCIGLLREMLASDRWNPRHTLHTAAEAEVSAAQGQAPIINNYYYNAPISTTNVQGDLNQVNNNILVSSSEDWGNVFDSLFRLTAGNTSKAELSESLEKIQYLPESATEEETSAWFEENGHNMAEGLDRMLANQDESLDDMFLSLLSHAGTEQYPSRITELSQRLPKSTELLLKQSIIVDRMFTGLLHSFGLDDQLDFSPCGVMYSILLEQRMKEAMMPLYQADREIGSWPVNKNKSNSLLWGDARLRSSAVTIGNFYGGHDMALFSARMAELSRQAQDGLDTRWWSLTYNNLARAGDLRNGSAHAGRLTPKNLDDLRSLVLGEKDDITCGLLSRIGEFCRLDAALSYHNPNKLAVSAIFKSKAAMQHYTEYGI